MLLYLYEPYYSNSDRVVCICFRALLILTLIFCLRLYSKLQVLENEHISLFCLSILLGKCFLEKNIDNDDSKFSHRTIISELSNRRSHTYFCLKFDEISLVLNLSHHVTFANTEWSFTENTFVSSYVTS